MEVFWNYLFNELQLVINIKINNLWNDMIMIYELNIYERYT